jgi:hypothetical protein
MDIRFRTASNDFVDDSGDDCPLCDFVGAQVRAQLYLYQGGGEPERMQNCCPGCMLQLLVELEHGTAFGGETFDRIAVEVDRYVL